MKKCTLIILILIACINSFAQPENKVLNLSLGIKQSLVYVGNMDYYYNRNCQEKFCYSPGLNVEYKFFKNYLAVFTGLDFYATHGSLKYYMYGHSETPPYQTFNSICDEKWKQKFYEIPLGLKVFFVNNNQRLNPYLGVGTMFKFSITDKDVITTDLYTNKVSSEIITYDNKYHNLTTDDCGLNFVLVSIGSDLKLKNRFSANFEIACKYNCIVPDNYMFLSTLGLKYNW